MTKAEFLEKVGQRWDEFQNLHKYDNLYDFEKEYTKLAMEILRYTGNWNIMVRRRKSGLSKFAWRK